jgi:hypothetical protein
MNTNLKNSVDTNESKEVPFETLVGKTLKNTYYDKGSEQIVFVTDDDETYVLFHKQSCCESVTVEDICGDLDDLIGSTIIKAELYTQEKDSESQSAESLSEQAVKGGFPCFEKNLPI